ncbi:hypothetical protein SAICODRAFT_23930 [Saitoella complicata NRRL Y-17804]|uniref:uncharacterized protein n=1 Tax=Saitoella complicata (strain BCRC 22490 / CBS 7301 / JCM 7358 / NBRC 10748 / NRRL Y-17804) TaxID=698492 RepID=UPI000866A6F1|nr:uncharacterized protein SAICODRAFT_23930 [Saitoella complicata NRRL Y-17804]ODQ54669.1 hypothetical protein SAICODRAFT_23930 [Saitoella complicata NRRL Y-17804]
MSNFNLSAFRSNSSTGSPALDSRSSSSSFDEDPTDCLPCRLTGFGAFTGLGGYIIHSGMKELNKQYPADKVHEWGMGPSGRMPFVMRRFGVYAFGGGLILGGVWRLVM